MNSAYEDKTSYGVPWNKHHTGKDRSVVQLPDIWAILPPIDEPIHTLDMHCHCMNIISYQCMNIQFPDKFGLDKYFCLFASLYVETLLLIICGQVIKGVDSMKCGLCIVGAHFLVTVNDIKGARYSFQVEGCVKYSKLKQANMGTGNDALILSWLANKNQINEMCFYWKVILELMIDFLVFIRSLILYRWPL